MGRDYYDFETENYDYRDYCHDSMVYIRDYQSMRDEYQARIQMLEEIHKEEEEKEKRKHNAFPF